MTICELSSELIIILDHKRDFSHIYKFIAEPHNISSQDIDL